MCSCSNDAQQDANFLNRIDKATAFVTRSVLCVVLKDGGDVRAVVQLINKIETPNSAEAAVDPPTAGVAKPADAAPKDLPFVEGDAATVRKDAANPILDTIGGIALHQLLTSPPPQSPMAC